ncbi:SDR family oxidoreductase [Candidatus Woesearchaeota archaeon]|nr:SDR family oxidoreductase [Candidatus Woesearchaeota archaeon]
MKPKIDQKHIIITGGSGGIGKIISHKFLQLGDLVTLISRNIEHLKNTKEEFSKYSKSIHILQADVSNHTHFSKIESFINSKLNKKVDVLINAAGVYGPIGRLETTKANEWEETFKINVYGTVNMCRLIIPFMKKSNNGTIINFSGGGDGPFPNFTSYSASKGAIIRFTESLASELIEFGITVNAIAPGAVNTQLLDKVLKTSPDKVGKEFYEKSLIQKSSGGASPEKTAELIALLASGYFGKLSGKILSSIHDDFQKIKTNSSQIINSDIYNLRRIKPTDKDFKW